jgi:hypothetical protein
MLADQILEPVYRFRFGNIEFHRPKRRIAVSKNLGSPTMNDPNDNRELVCAAGRYVITATGNRVA